jgi:hypothetical protein
MTLLDMSGSYWLSRLDDSELEAALSNVADITIQMVRTWAFDTKPISENTSRCILLPDLGSFSDCPGRS